MHCVKTGFSIYISGINKFTRMDLFFNGKDLYSNNNDLYDGRPDNIEFDIVCDEIIPTGDYNKIINPVLSKKLIDYVSDFKYKSYNDQKFIDMYGKL